MSVKLIASVHLSTLRNDRSQIGQQHQFRLFISVVAPDNIIKHQGQVVQSVVSLTTSLRVISLTVLADSIHNILKFFADKM